MINYAFIQQQGKSWYPEQNGLFNNVKKAEVNYHKDLFDNQRGRIELVLIGIGSLTNYVKYTMNFTLSFSKQVFYVKMRNHKE